MSWIANDNTQDKMDAVEVVEKKPATKLDEFLSAEGLEDWPLPESYESSLDHYSDDLLLGTQGELAAILEQAAPLKLQMIDEIEKRLSDIEAKLNLYASLIVTEDKRPSCLVDHLFHSPPRTSRAETSESDGVRSHRSLEEHKTVVLAEMLVQTKQRSLNYFKFTGFVHDRLIQLPSNLEAPPILHRVSTAQNFNPGFRNFWKKIFLSEASSAVFQDSFWWIFLDKFNKEAGFEEDKDLLFDRIADSYAALFISINTDVRDKFLSVYPDCLSQAIYCVYKEAFPESKLRFDEEFKHYLINLIYEWVTGLRPVPGTWKTWNEESLTLNQASTHGDTTKKVLEATAVQKKVELTLDIEACTKVIDKLGTNDGELSQGFISQENTKTSMAKSNLSRLESHHTGPGPEFERVKFNISGRSPLIAHYLHMLQLRSEKQPGIKVRRTEIVKFQSPTYQQYISSALNRSESLKKDYIRIRDQTYTDILDLNQRQRDINKEMNVLKKALTNSRTTQERCLAIDAILEYKESGQKAAPLVEYPTSDVTSNSSTSCDEEET